VSLWQGLDFSTKSQKVDVDKRKKELFVSQNKEKVRGENSGLWRIFQNEG